MKIYISKFIVFIFLIFIQFKNSYSTLSFDSSTSSFDKTSTSTSSRFYFTPSSLNISSVFENNFEIPAGKTIILESALPISGLLDLSGTLSLCSDLHFDSNLTYSGIGRIAGNGYAIHLDGDFNIPNSHFFHIDTDTIIEGHGNSINLSDNAEILVDDNVTLTLRNIIINNSKNGIGNPAIKLTSHRSKLALDNTVLNMANDFYIDRGQLFIHNDVSFTGTNALVYRSTVPSFITSKSTLNFDLGTTFDFRPSTTGTPGLLAKDLLIMQDASSQLYLDGCSLKTTMTGLRLTKGQLIFDNKISITSAAQLQLKSTEICDYKDFGTIAYSVNWSSDGRYLAVAGYNGSTDLIIYSFDGLTLTQITSKDFNDRASSVNWSPDGRYLAVGGTNGTADLIIYSFDGLTLTQITSKDFGTWAYSVNWSPDGKYLAVGGANDTADLIIYSFDGSTLTQITSKDFGDEAISVNWSPDGRYLAVGGRNGTTDLVIYSFDGLTLTQITSKDFGTWAYSVNWSPDGRYLAVGGLNDTTDLIIYSFDGSTLTQITSKDFGDRAHSVNWSSDGRYLAVGGYNGSTDLIIYSFDGSTLTQIISKDFGTWAYSVNWSPDGRYLAVGGLNDTTDLVIYGLNYGPETQTQAISNSIIFGNSTLGSSYDLNVRGLSGAKIEIDGLVNYDNVN